MQGLNRLAYPCRYADMVPLFGRAPSHFSMIFNQTVDFIDTNWEHLLQYFSQGWLSRSCLQTFSDSVYRRGAVCLISTPKVQQRIW